MGPIVVESDPKVDPLGTSGPAPANVQRRAPGFLDPTLSWTFSRQDWVFVGALYLLAWIVRFPILDSQPYTAEAAHYWIARELWDGTNNWYAIDGWHSDVPWLFWQRPLFSLLLWPGAAVSFDAYRVLHLALTATMPALGFLLLRSLGTRALAAGAGGLVLAVHPQFVTWSVLVLPDALTATLTLAALLAAQDGRLRLTGGLLLAAAWVKEVAILTPLALLALALWREPDGTRTRWFPLRVGYWSTTFAAVCALAFVPLAYSLSIGGAFPGWGRGGDAGHVLERIWLTPWFAALPVLALAWPASRRLGVVALSWGVFFLAYRFILGRAVEIWYYVVPATLVVLAGAAALDAAWRTARPPALRKVAAASAGIVMALAAAQVTLDDTVATKRAVLTPFSQDGFWSLRQSLAFEEVRDDALHDALAQLEDGGVWFTVDVDWSFVIHPISDRVDKVYLDYSSRHPEGSRDLERVAEIIESEADVTLVKRIDSPFATAILSTYGDCAVAQSDPYVALGGKGCTGRSQILRATFDAQ